MEEHYIKSLILANPKEIKKLYEDYRVDFLNFGKKYGLDYDDLVDIYQEAFIALRKHALNGKLTTVKSALKTYLFGIGKFMIYDLIKEKKKTTLLDDSILSFHKKTEAIEPQIEKYELTIQQQLLRTYFKRLGNKCQELLTLFYSRGLTIEDVIVLTNYTSSSVVRSQKSRCLKTLKDMIKSRK